MILGLLGVEGGQEGDGAASQEDGEPKHQERQKVGSSVRFSLWNHFITGGPSITISTTFCLHISGGFSLISVNLFNQDFS